MPQLQMPQLHQQLQMPQQQMPQLQMQQPMQQQPMQQPMQQQPMQQQPMQQQSVAVPTALTSMVESLKTLVEETKKVCTPYRKIYNCNPTIQPHYPTI